MKYVGDSSTNTWTCTDGYTKDASSLTTFASSTDTTNNCNMMAMKSISSFSDGKAYLKGHFNRRFETADDSEDLSLELGEIKMNIKVEYPGATYQEVGKTTLLLNPDSALKLKGLALIALLAVISSLNI